jgi:nucleoside-diphosphate-sugar epimerase
VVQGDVFVQHSLDAAARGQDAVVSMLGVSFAAFPRPTNDFSQGTRNLIAALKAAGFRRLIVQSSFGVGDSRRDAGLLERGGLTQTRSCRSKRSVRAASTTPSSARPV